MKILGLTICDRCSKVLFKNIITVRGVFVFQYCKECYVTLKELESLDVMLHMWVKEWKKYPVINLSSIERDMKDE